MLLPKPTHEFLPTIVWTSIDEFFRPVYHATLLLLPQGDAWQIPYGVGRMCGISAIIDFAPGQTLPGTLLRMHAQIPHRGPDGEGFLLVQADYRFYHTYRADALQALPCTSPWCLGLAFRWLKIQDMTDAATQPMCSRDRTVWLLFNGEIYNFAALRAELQQCGHQFATRSDTEVVLAAYQEWRQACFARFRGMWAMVLVDLHSKKVVISRDRFGIKPLYYCVDGTRLLLASELKQLVAATSAKAQTNLKLACRFLRGASLHHDEETFFHGMMALPPATYAEIDLTQPKVASPVGKPYWDLSDFFCPEPSQALPFREARVALDELLRSSVAEHVVARVPVGCLLSGGLDSSMITALLVQLNGRSGEPIPSFSLVCPEQPILDETPHIETVATYLGLHNVKTTVDVTWLRETLPRITWAQEAPLIGMAWAAQYRIYQVAAAHGMRVLLDGQGADEILAGYPRHQYALWQDDLAHLRVRALAREMAGLLRLSPRLLLYLTKQVMLAPLRRQFSRRAPQPVDDGLSPAGKALLVQDSVLHAPQVPSRDVTRLNQVLYSDVRYGNLKTVLNVGDRNSMAHTIEARVPYLDHRIIEFAFQLPGHYKAGAGLRKRILRHIAYDYVPASIVTRRDRIGFGLPQEQWLHEHWRDLLYTAIHSAVFRTTPLLDQAHLTACITDFYSGRRHNAARVWRIYALWQWLDVYNMTLE